MFDSVIVASVYFSFLLSIFMLSLIAKKSDRSQIRTAFLIVLCAIAVLNMGTLLELTAQLITGNSYISFKIISYIGNCLTPVAVLYLGKVVSKPDWRLKKIHALFLVVPAISIVMVSIDLMHGSYYYFHSVYSYGCIAAGIVFMIAASAKNTGIFSKQSILVITGIIVAVVPNILYSFDLWNLPYSTTTIAMTITLLCFVVAFSKYRFTKSLPIALREVVDLISDGYLVVDKKGHILDYNEALLTMFQEKIEVVLGEKLQLFVAKYFRDATYDDFLRLQERAVEKRGTVSAETYVKGDMCVIVEITPVFRNNDHVGSIVLISDITQTKLLIDALQEASRAKGDFLSHMSHEIRTPLNAIIGMLRIGLSTDDIDKKDYCLHRADNASKHLLGLINDILDMSKIEADKFELSYSEFDFEKMLIDITNVANTRADEKRLDFVVNLNSDVPSHLECDELRLSQVITNLLTNAIKFTPEEGTVVLKISKTEETEDEIGLRIEVSDDGIGISEEQQERLFTSYNQADSKIAGKFGGTGLGLAISKRIVELMGGKIWVESELAKGSRFIFTINTKKLAGQRRKRLNRKLNASELRILAVDDSLETRDYLIHVMEALNISCDVAKDGPEALEMIKKAADKPYDIIFVDWTMPKMNGVELSRKIKEINSENSIAIMIPVADLSEIEEEAKEAGVVHFLSKPIFPSTLIDAINICAGIDKKEPEAREQSSPQKPGFDFHGYTILIAEDIEINQEIIKAILEETGVSIDFADNGKIAVSMYDEHPERYDLILMDVNMPEMNGYQATEAIRALPNEYAKSIPIIAMTANVFKEDIDKCLESGMNGHTGKPVNTEALLAMLHKYLIDPASRQTRRNARVFKKSHDADKTYLA